MEAILLKPKNGDRYSVLVIFDELITGIISLEYFAPVFTGANKGMRIMPTSFLFENFYFPMKNGKSQARLVAYMTGIKKKETLKHLRYYNCEDI